MDFTTPDVVVGPAGVVEFCAAAAGATFAWKRQLLLWKRGERGMGVENYFSAQQASPADSARCKNNAHPPNIGASPQDNNSARIHDSARSRGADGWGRWRGNEGIKEVLG